MQVYTDMSCNLLFTIMASMCDANNLPWWKTSIIYQIYPRSFQDSNGDGVGDLQGIQSRLDHFEFIGVDAIWLSPIYESPMKDFGYDISDFTSVDPIFGDLGHFRDLVEDAHSRSIKVIMDYVPNHTSDLHSWFKASKKGGKDNPYADYYVWSDGKVLEDGTRAPPNNWLSIFGGPAWEWVEERQQFYYHAYVKEQPDLNYRNEKVREEMKDVFRFWLSLGVDGFRVDAIHSLWENHYNKDEPLLENTGLTEDEYFAYNHIYSQEQDELHEVIREWREVFDEHERQTGKYVFMVMETWDLNKAEKYYNSGSDIPFNFNLVSITPDCGGKEIHELIDSWMRRMPDGKWPNFVLGNHDRSRITTRKGPKYADAMNLMLLTLPGTPTSYQGEEIAMRDIEVSYEDTMDPWGKNFGPDRYRKYSRDPCRAPMQWNDQKNAGFSKAEKTWLPLNPDYKERNVKVQKNPPSGRSSLLMYRAVAFLRRKPAFQNNALEYCIVNNDILSYKREDSNAVYLIILNVGFKASTNDYSGCFGDTEKGEIVLVTPDSNFKEKDTTDFKKLTLQPGDGLVILIRKKISSDEL